MLGWVIFLTITTIVATWMAVSFALENSNLREQKALRDKWLRQTAYKIDAQSLEAASARKASRRVHGFDETDRREADGLNSY